MKNLCRVIARQTFDPSNLLGQCVFDPARLVLPDGDTTYVTRGKPEFSGDSAVDSVVLSRPLKIPPRSVTLVRQVLAFHWKPNILGANIPVKEKISSLSKPPVWAERLKELRTRIGFTQKELAAAIGVTQSAIAQWEKGSSKLSPMACVAVGRLAGEEKDWWFNLAGPRLAEIERSVENQKQVPNNFVSVPLLKDSAAAGSGRFIEEKDVEDLLLLPSSWVPHPAGTKCIKIDGNSMSPILEDGYVVAIDTTQRDLKKLVNEMVAARDPEGGVTVKWLRHAKHYLLVAQHTSVDYNPQILNEDSGWEIIGKVLWWIGKPPKRSRGKK
jgi:transcriptional regulator with XRE-family HTH domain